MGRLVQGQSPWLDQDTLRFRPSPVAHPPHIVAQRPRAHWQNRGYVVSVEDQNAFRLQGTSATLAGKPDRIAANDEEAIIIDVKTDQENPSHAIQVMIYLYVPKVFDRYRGVRLARQVAYPHRIVDIPADAADTVFTNTLGSLIRRFASGTPATRIPSSRECGFCDITAADCPERVDDDLDTEQASTTDF